MATNKVLELVQQLLAIAEHPNTPEHEAAAALGQANRLITKHAIDEALLRASQTEDERREPTKDSIKHGYNTWLHIYQSLLTNMGKTFRVSVAHISDHTDLYGAAEDVAWVQMLFASTKLQFLSKIDPNWDESLGYDANVYNFKVAGYKWKDIDALAVRNGHASRESLEKKDIYRSTAERNGYEIVEETENSYWVIAKVPNGFYHKLKAAYLRHAKSINDLSPVKTQSHQVYRLSFAEGFKTKLSNRLSEMRVQNSKDYDSIPGAALAIVDFGKLAEQMMFNDHPDLDPAVQRQRIQDAVRERQEMLDAMTPEARAKYLRDEEKLSNRRQRSIKYYSIDSAASARGNRVASSIDLTRKSGYADAAPTRGELA